MTTGRSGDPAAVGDYPRFSGREMARRWNAVAAEAEAVDDLVVYGSERSGAALQWLTGWPVTREAALLWRPGDERPLLFVQFANHVENAARVASACEVRWGGLSTFASVAAVLERRHGRPFRLGLLGSVPLAALPALGAAGAEPVPLDAAFQRLRLVKSPEEIEWARRGAALTDAAVAALAEHATVGLRESDLGAIVEGAYLGEGATNLIHYFCTTSMRDPAARVPAQWPSDRRLRDGDVVVCEVSANWWGYPGQLLRTFTLGGPPTDRYAELHGVASAAFEAIAARVAPGTTGSELEAAARIVEDAGFSTCDDLVHGFVGGYLPPVVPGGGRPFAHGDFELAEGMTLVVQPNVVTPGGLAGVQTGELLAVTSTGFERLHTFPAGVGLLGGGPPS